MCCPGGIQIVELPTTSVSNEESTNSERNDDDNISINNNLYLLKECDDHFKKICDIDAGEGLSLKHVLINKLFFLISNIRKKENLLFKLRVYNNFDKYLLKLREEPFFQN